MDIVLKNNRNSPSKPSQQGFEELYTAVRRHEQKMYTDDELQLLPDFDGTSAEWEVRRRSSSRLITRLIKKQRHLGILEIGCGNGWLSAKMADIADTQVTGIDVNSIEINQAIRVFKHNNLRFICDGFNDSSFEREKFDVIVFAASLQYFPSVTKVLVQALAMLKKGGEVHIIDTPFYTPTEAVKAHERCRRYYTDMGIPEMAGHYFHHSMSEFWGFNYKVLFNPHSYFNRLFKKAPFPWVAITK